MSDSEITKVLEIPKEIFFRNGILNLDALVKSNEFENAKILDFSGVETVTDLLFWMLKSVLSKNQNFNREDLDYFLLNGCANISIWTLNYLNLFNKRNLFSKPTTKLNERFSCCPRISESLMVSLNFDAQINAQNEQIFDQAKCVLINSNSFNARLSENIFNLNQLKSDKNTFFKYIKLKLSKKKTINFYECSQSNSELFLSEKNLVILTYDANQDEETIKNSVLPRLLIVMAKNILPVKVLILGVGQMDTNFVLQIQSSVNKALKILEKKLRKAVDLHLKNFLNLNFNLQLELSDILNLAEHIDYLIKILDYGAINIDNYSNKMLLIDNVGLRQETPDSPEYHINEVNNLITNITTADFAELRSLKAPPSGVQIVAEAMCYLFAKPASYQNFIRLINSPSFINQFKEFDLNSVNEYKLKHIKQYVDMPNFNPDYIAKISKTASVLCHFIRSVYFYCTSPDMAQIDQTDDQNSSKSIDTSLSRYIVDNSFYMFKWHLYYDQKYEKNEQECDELMEKYLNLKNKFILTIDEFNQLFESSKKLKYFQSKFYKQLSMRFAKAENARGQFFYNEKTSFIITDPTWLMNVIDILSNGQTNESKLNKILGANIPVWHFSELKEKLKNLCPTGQILGYLISFLKENNLLIVTDDEKVIPLFWLSKNQEASLTWNEEWSDLEYKIVWELFSPLPFSVFSEFICMYFDSKTCLKLWKSGFFYRDTHFDALIQYTKSEIRLSVRMSDPEKNFNLDDKSYLDHFKTIYMDFYVYLKHLLIKNHIPHKTKIENESISHPIQLENDEPKILNTRSVDVITLYYLISKSDVYFYRSQIGKYLHNFKSTNNDSLRCADCCSNFDYYTKLKNAFFVVYPKLNEINVIQTKIPLFWGTADSENENLLAAFEPEVVITEQNYEVYSFKFMDYNLALTENIYLVLACFKSTGSDTIWIELNKMQIKCDQNSEYLKVKHSLLSSNSNLTDQINLGDVIQLKIRKITEKQKTASVSLNGLKILEIEYSHKYLIPLFTFTGHTEDTPTNTTYLSKCLEYNNSIHAKKYTKTDLNSLLNHCLEARDRLYPNLISPATIVDVRDNLVLVHFDGWASNYDFWTEIQSPDLRPVGWAEYHRRKVKERNWLIEDDLTNIKFDTPINYKENTEEEFRWENYLSGKNASAVPFDIFTLDQKNGMTISDFKGNKNQQVLTSCLNLPNTSLKLGNLQEYISKNWNHLIEKNIITKNGSTDVPTRGVIILPSSINNILSIKRNSLLEEFNLHMCCLIKSNDQQAIYAHLFKSSGIKINKKILDSNDLVLILVSAYMVLISKFSSIVPDDANIFIDQNEDLTGDQITEYIRLYLRHLINYLSLFVSQNDMLKRKFECNVKKYLNLLARDEQKSDIYKFQKNPSLQNVNLGRCYYCHLSDYKYKSSSEPKFSLDKKFNEYSKFCTRFGLIGSDTSLNLDINFAEKYPNLTNLLLINVPLCIDSPVFFKLFNSLIEVKLLNNDLELLPDSLLELDGLKTLSFNNRLKSENLSFEHLTSLESLELENLELKKTNKIIHLPGSIKQLKVSRSSFDYFCFDLNPESIVELKLSGIPLMDMDKYGKIDSLISFDNLKNELKKSKIIKEYQVRKLFNNFDWNSNGYLETREITKINAFIFKKYLRLGPNIPEIIFRMVNIKTLDLSFQSIEQIPDEIENLKNLKSLILNNCILLENISPKLANLSINKLDLNNCLSLVTPPSEVAKRGFNSVLTYLKRLLSGSVELKRTKLMLVGLGQAGKTSLLRSLKGEQCDESTELTDGIDIDDWIIDLEDGSNLTFSMWDFAGQSVYYNTHQFFLSSRGVYLLVWNVRLGSEYAGLEFWLSSISVHAPGAPVFVVGTHVDQVFKYTLDEEDLKLRFKDIVGFHFVSSKTGEGIEELKQKIIEATLEEKYIDEKIPEAWTNFEKSIKQRANKDSLLSFNAINSLAEKNGIYDPEEILQAVKFLNDLGSLQYFENKSLKDKVIINPQWIVNAFAKIVSVKQTCIQNGRLSHDKIGEIWKDYPEELHEWMLKLTEEFDLTFPVPDKKMSIVPCLLPDTEPKFNWPEIDPNNPVKIKQFKVNYKFEYLPIGLFNRIQVRLFQYGDSSIIWKKGSLLKKNSHLALISQSKNALSIKIKVQGVTPENIVFVIHETIETLINDSFNGLQYDFSFPCPDCVESQSTEPYLFSSTLLKRANEMKAPFLQCRKFFHAVSIQEMMAIMPIDDTNNMDLNLEYTIRDLNSLKNTFKYDIMFWYCEQDLQFDQDKSVNPLNAIKAIESQGYHVWYSEEPSVEKLDKLTSVIKQSKLVIFGVSNDFAMDSKCVQIFELVKNLIKKTYLLIEFGQFGSHEWLRNPIFASACADFRIIMQDPKRYSTKIADAFESIEKIVQADLKIEDEKKNPDVFISYCWANSHEAIKKGSKGTGKSLGWLDPRSLVKFFEQNGIHAWIDVDNLDSTTQMFGEITKGMNLAKVIVACVSDEYVESQNCKLEFRFAHISLKIPIVKAIVGLGSEWRKNEIAFLGSNYPEANFQYETPEAFSLLLKYVRQELSKSKKPKRTEEPTENNNVIDSNNTAIQELYELTQRKFLRQLIQFSNQVSTSRSYPRLLCIDFIDEEKISKLKFIKRLRNVAATVEPEDMNYARAESVEENSASSKLIPCIRPMCEYEESWHFSDCIVILPELLSSYCPFLVRIISILRNGSSSNELGVFLSEQGNNLFNDMQEKSQGESLDMGDSYHSFRSFFISEFENDRYYSLSWLGGNSITKPLGLENCELRNGKILWMCKKHIEETDAEILSDQDNFTGNQIEQEKNNLIEELDEVNLKIY